MATPYLTNLEYSCNTVTGWTISCLAVGGTAGYSVWLYWIGGGTPVQVGQQPITQNPQQVTFTNIDPNFSNIWELKYGTTPSISPTWTLGNSGICSENQK